jgi:adenylyl cyclase-associated protein
MTQTTPHDPARQPIQVEESKPNVLTAVIRRLEAATSRLEDIASTSVAFDATASGQTAGTSVLPTPSEASTPKAAESLPPSIQAFDKLLDTELKEWLELSAKLGDVINGQVRRAQGGIINRCLTWDRQKM